MPSINDVYNQLVTENATLGQIHADILAETNETTQVKASVDQLDSDLKAGFDATTKALTTIALIDVEAVKLLYHLTQQADSMICALEHISQNTCGILTQVTIQTGLQARLRDDADAVRDIEEFAHPDAVLERERLLALRAEIERCCPPEVLPPACSYEPCPHPRPASEPKLPPVAPPKQRG
jgi:hypothetical protein